MATFKKPCIHCGTLVDGDARYCPTCASSTPFAHHCPSCLREVTPAQAVCSGCGRQLRVACPACGVATFVAEAACQSCGATLMVTCPNRRCGQPQFFENTKCTACGKKIKLK